MFLVKMSSAVTNVVYILEDLNFKIKLPGRVELMAPPVTLFSVVFLSASLL